MATIKKKQVAGLQTALDAKANVAGQTFTGLINFSGTGHAGFRTNSLTTTQRNALTPANGDIIYNSTLTRIQVYQNGVWVDVAYTEMIVEVIEAATNVTTGDGKRYIPIGSKLNTHNLVYTHAQHVTAGSGGGTSDVQLHNVTDAVDMLSTKITIDSGETKTSTAATPAVINASNDFLSENDLLRVDIDAATSTPPKGLMLVLGFLGGT